MVQTTPLALVLSLEWAERFDDGLAELTRNRSLHWFGADRDCQAWEPGGDEFLSPALIEALCMARPWGFPVEGVNVPVRIWHGALDLAVPVGMGRYLERVLPDAVATYFPHEGHHFVYDRWREILGVLVTVATARVSQRSGSPAPLPATDPIMVPTSARPA